MSFQMLVWFWFHFFNFWGIKVERGRIGKMTRYPQEFTENSLKRITGKGLGIKKCGGKLSKYNMSESGSSAAFRMTMGLENVQN